MRQAVFSSLGAAVDGASVLDLFAGTGGYGLEAASRGARAVTFVEKGRPALLCLRKNCEVVGKSLAAADRAAEWKLIPTDVFSWLRAATGEWDLIFADPPYSISDPQLAQLLTALPPLLSPNPAARVVLELPGDRDLDVPATLKLVRRLGKPRQNQPNCCILAAQHDPSPLV